MAPCFLVRITEEKHVKLFHLFHGFNQVNSVSFLGHRNGNSALIKIYHNFGII